MLACSHQVWYIVDWSPGWVKSETIKLIIAASPLTTQYSGIRAKTGYFGIRMMCSS